MRDYYSEVLCEMTQVMDSVKASSEDEIDSREINDEIFRLTDEFIKAYPETDDGSWDLDVKVDEFSRSRFEKMFNIKDHVFIYKEYNEDSPYGEEIILVDKDHEAVRRHLKNRVLKVLYREGILLEDEAYRLINDSEWCKNLEKILIDPSIRDSCFIGSPDDTDVSEDCVGFVYRESKMYFVIEEHDTSEISKNIKEE